MPSSPKPAILALGAALAAGSAIAQDKAAKKPTAGKETKTAVPSAKEDDYDIPVPAERPQHGVKVPLYGADGKLKMRFEIGVGTRVDELNIHLEKLRVETFKDDGTPEFDMDLPDAMFNRRTKNLTSKVNVTIKRSDFEITGNSLTFNIVTRQGTLGGGVKMIIYNQPEEAAPAARNEKPSVEVKPIPEPKK